MIFYIYSLGVRVFICVPVDRFELILWLMHDTMGSLSQPGAGPLQGSLHQRLDWNLAGWGSPRCQGTQRYSTISSSPGQSEWGSPAKREGDGDVTPGQCPFNNRWYNDITIQSRACIPDLTVADDHRLPAKPILPTASIRSQTQVSQGLEERALQQELSSLWRSIVNQNTPVARTWKGATGTSVCLVVSCSYSS